MLNCFFHFLFRFDIFQIVHIQKKIKTKIFNYCQKDAIRNGLTVEFSLVLSLAEIIPVIKWANATHSLSMNLTEPCDRILFVNI